MSTTDNNWPQGIRLFWQSLQGEGKLGEGSGFYPEEGRLEIYRCFNKQLKPELLEAADKITRLIIRNNELKQESYDIISRLTSLQRLVLESVGPVIMDIDVCRLNSLTDVTIGSATNTDLPGWVFRLPHLKRLNISNTRIEKLREGVSYSCFSELEKLDISYTSIDELPDFGTDKLEQLYELRVANTSIEKIPSCYFSPALRFLDCSHTNIGVFDSIKDAVHLEVFRCSDNSSMMEFPKLNWKSLRVVDLSRCMNLKKFPSATNYDKLELAAVCECTFESLPSGLIKHCIDKKLSFKQENVKYLTELIEDNGQLREIPEEMRGIYIRGTFLRQIDFRYLLDNDPEFLRYYLEKDKQKALISKHEIRIMLLGDGQDVKDAFLAHLFPDYEEIFYTEYGGLKVLDTGGGELDFVLRELDRDTNISIWTSGSGENEQLMQSILFNEHDFFIIILDERDGMLNQELARRWLKRIEQYVQYATIGFVMVGDGRTAHVMLSRSELEEGCNRLYFRFLNDAYRLDRQNMEDCYELRSWLVSGIKEKSNYDIKILPEWKKYRVEIAAYLNLRRVINSERFRSLFRSDEVFGQKAFVNYLIESRSLFQIRYAEGEEYYFNTEWVISALFGLLELFQQGELPEPFDMETLRECLQMNSIYYLDFFQDRESLKYLMNILEGMGIVYQYGNMYYRPLAASLAQADQDVKNAVDHSSWMIYRAAYPTLTVQMVSRIIAVLAVRWLEFRGSTDGVSVFKECVLFWTGKERRRRECIVLKVMAGCPGELLFHAVKSDNRSGDGRVPAEKRLRECIGVLLKELGNITAFPLWTADISVRYTANGISGFVPLTEIENYTRSGYASAFIAQYNTVVDTDELYRKYLPGSQVNN